MTGETDLNLLLKNMAPRLQSDELIFVTLPDQDARPYLSRALGFFQEEEGITLILTKQIGDRIGLGDRVIFRRITLSVHSSLTAVGFLARVTGALADAGISTNVVSGYFHDHLFIEEHQADLALEILNQLSSQSQES